MAADSWTITAVDRDTVTVTVAVGGSSYQLKVGTDQVDPTTRSALIASVKPFVTEFRQSVLDKATAPDAGASAVGYTEQF